MRIAITIGLLLISCIAYSQEVTIFGRVVDDYTGAGIAFASIYVENENIAVESDDAGAYSIKIPNNITGILKVSRLGYNDAEYAITPTIAGSKRNVDFILIPQQSDVVVVTSSRVRDLGMVKEEVQDIKFLPTASGNLESALPSIALGTTSGSGGELSSQYNVRGGNYDENLVYVNDFEIFRPQLISSSQQEGLSFPNIDLIQNLSFSSGGFAAQYGDRLSSVLDIKYKRPEARKHSVSLGLQGGSLHTEGAERLGANAYNKLRYLVGLRYKTNKLLLASQDVKGEYNPSYYDAQTYLTYNFTKDLQLGVLGNYNLSIFDFVPETGETVFGPINDVRRLRVYYEGNERDRFVNGTVGVSMSYVPEGKDNPYYLKFLMSHYRSNESENYDILGQYFLSSVDANLGSSDEEFGRDVVLLGAGTQHKYARNDLFNTVQNAEIKGGIEFESDYDDGFSSHFIQWSTKYQQEYFDDRLNEWERLDSADYNLPFESSNLDVDRVLKSENELQNHRGSAYAQYVFTKKKTDKYELKINTGLRYTYRHISRESLISPRAQILIKPLSWNKNISFKLAGGIYYQQPFYREMRHPRFGTLDKNLKAQRAIHMVAGITYDFKIKRFSNKPFRLISEVYYKILDDMISFDLDNVRIRYSGANDSKGYVRGLDLRINGEFVPGVESWVNMSFLQARERLNGIQHKRGSGDRNNPKLIDNVPRPTDQFMSVGVYFQDYLPMNNKFKVKVGFNYGSGLPIGFVRYNSDSKTFLEYRNSSRLKPYHRVDIGFGYQLWDKAWISKKPNHPLRFADNCWISLDVFNLMKVSNQSGVNWIKDFEGNYGAVPNNLTSRRISGRLRIEF